jgi:ABC-type branched-subunit amino acid transport system ATPase component
MTHTLMRLENVVVRYGGVTAVDQVSFELAEGAIHGLVGPNGSGKSTLLAALSGARTADEGRITLDDVETRKLAPWRLAGLGLARTFQGTRLVPGLTVRENIMLGTEWGAGRRKGDAGDLSPDARIEEALELCRLTHLAHADPHGLAYGIQRLVELARAVVSAPRLLLLDEPTAGMHAGERAEIEEVQLLLRSRGVTQVLVEHDMDMIARVCERVFVLNSGRLIADGTPAEIISDPAVQEAYLGRPREEGAHAS